MAKVKKLFFCSNCGVSSPKWVGKCPSCGEWNTYQEEVVVKGDTREQQRSTWRRDDGSKKRVRAVPLPEIQQGQTRRLQTPDTELDRVLGGGIVGGSLV
ncbi:MAG: DNA repair protein RadA, partial [Saprospiraceae bacterium]|nr:DNA repair protein RadA [Saprospiraceae bacterium]